MRARADTTPAYGCRTHLWRRLIDAEKWAWHGTGIRVIAAALILVYAARQRF
jgi:hypothetical protein